MPAVPPFRWGRWDSNKYWAAKLDPYPGSPSIFINRKLQNNKINPSASQPLLCEPFFRGCRAAELARLAELWLGMRDGIAKSGSLEEGGLPLPLLSMDHVRPAAGLFPDAAAVASCFLNVPFVPAWSYYWWWPWSRYRVGFTSQQKESRGSPLPGLMLQSLFAE